MSDYYPKSVMDHRLAALAEVRDFKVKQAEAEAALQTAYQDRLRAESMIFISAYANRIAAREAYLEQITPFVGETRAAQMAEDVATLQDADQARIQSIFAETAAAVAQVDPIIDQALAKAAAAREEYAEEEKKAKDRHEAWKTVEEERLRQEAETAARQEEERLNRIQEIHDKNLDALQSARDGLASKQAALDAALEAQANPAQGETRTAAELQQAVDDATSARDFEQQWVTMKLNKAVSFRNEHANLELSPVPVLIAPPADDE